MDFDDFLVWGASGGGGSHCGEWMFLAVLQYSRGACIGVSFQWRWVLFGLGFVGGSVAGVLLWWVVPDSVVCVELPLCSGFFPPGGKFFGVWA